MDFTKFLSLIDTQSLFFTRADKFEDPFEGSTPKANIDKRKEIEALVKTLPEEYKYSAINFLPNFAEIKKFWPKYAAINCWHENDHESAAMWNLYLKSKEGIATQTTFKNLEESLLREEEVILSRVKYIDYEVDELNEFHWFAPFVHKRKSFEHEREIRGIVMKFPSDFNHETKFDADTQLEEPIVNGIPIIVNLDLLIQNIYIDPNAPQWFVSLVDSVVKKYGYNFSVKQSNLDSSPLY